jgi:hypothetical protein
MSTNRKSVNEEQKPKQRVTGTMSQLENKLAGPFTPENTAIIMIDYSVGFTNIFRSHTIDENIRATTA